MKQKFKSIYFPDRSDSNKNVTLAFNENESDIFNAVKNLSTEEFRQLIQIKDYEDLKKKSEDECRPVNQYVKMILKNKVGKTKILKSRDVTFVGSKKVPFQRWYPYIEGYSPDFIDYIIDNYCPDAKSIYDPFAGTGTTLFSAGYKNINSLYSEINPLLVFLTETKIKILKDNEISRLFLSQEISNISDKIFEEIDKFPESEELKTNYLSLFKKSKYFDDKTFRKVLKLRSYIDYLKIDNKLLSDLVSIAAIASLLPVSYLKKAGDVRFKTEKELKREMQNIEEVLPSKLKEIAEDIKNLEYTLGSEIELILYNSKKIGLARNISIDSVITSPPYLNGTNYLRNTKLELWFLRYIQKDNDLRLFRDEILTSGINDVNKSKINSLVAPISSKSITLKKTLKELDTKTYDKRIPVMVRNYFEEMFQVFDGLRKHLANNSSVFIDIGDSIFAGVHVKTDKILAEILNSLNYTLKEEKILRIRRSRNKTALSQVLLVFSFSKLNNENHVKKVTAEKWQDKWNLFKTELPHQKHPFSKRNWGHPNHSLCSYQGKLKASIAHHLVNTFVPVGGSILDPFSGVGSIPFEAALNGRKSYGIDISLPAYFISKAKVSKCKRNICFEEIDKLSDFIKKNKVDSIELLKTKGFGFNKTISEYYEPNTLKEILLAKRYFQMNIPKTPEQMLIISSLLHILHGNRPYALSRRSHPIVPYAPQGEYIYKNLIKNLKDKVKRSLEVELPDEFVPGEMYCMDSTDIWPQEIRDLDAIITSPPFFDSTRFHLANWIRLWFSGWSDNDFKHKPQLFIEEKQKQDFKIYENIFRQSRERLKPGGVMVLHLGKSNKCDMAEQLKKIAGKWFRTVDVFDESVTHCESFGIRDIGTVTSHQYLVLS